MPLSNQWSCHPLTVWSETCTPVACWRSFCKALAVLLLAQKLHWCRSAAWSSTPQVTASLLVSLPCYQDYDGRHSQPACDCMDRCAILEELEYLCNLIGLQAQPHATSSDKQNAKLEKNPSWRIRKEQLSVATTCKTISFMEGFLAFASALPLCHLHLLQRWWN